MNVPLTAVLERGLGLPKDEEIVVNCGTGYRANIVASYLKNHGYPNVHSLAGGTFAWTRAGHELVN
jgi:hydroxyacylglutathione hydrolase